MMKIVRIAAALMLVSGVFALAGKIATAQPAGAATAKIKVTGTTVGGVAVGQAGEPVTLLFKAKNLGSTAFGTSGYYVSYNISPNATVSSAICVIPGTGIETASGADGACSLPALAPHSTNQSVITVDVNTDPPDLSVEACVGETPNAKTYCTTVTVVLND